MLLTLIALAMLLPACKEDTVAPMSNITGYVRLFNEFGTATTNASGVTVTLQSDEKTATAVTDDSGKFVITGIAKGNYNLTFTKDQFSKFIRYGVAHTADTENFIGSQSMYKIPQYQFFDPVVTSDGEYVTITASTNADKSYYAGIGFGKSPDFMSGSAFFPVRLTLTTAKNISVSFLKTYFTRSGYKTGDVVYIRLYPSASTGILLVDPATGLSSFTTYGPPSDALSFTL